MILVGFKWINLTILIMRIMKKTGKIVDFTPSKIITSIENAAEDIGVHVSSSDINLLSMDILNGLKLLARDENYSSTYEIRSLVVDTLINNGYKSIAKSYILNMF